MIGFAILLLILWALACLITAAGTLISLLRPRQHARIAVPHEKIQPPVSILKPLKGCDDGLEGNLETFFQLDYAKYELLFSLTSEQDPAYSVVSSLCQRYSCVSSRILINEIDAGPNPKVNNLLKSYESAEHDLILISDSNVRVQPDYLARLVRHLSPGLGPESGPKVGMVTAIISGRDESGIGGGLEAMYLNTFYARWMNLLFLIDRPCVIGKCMLFSKKTAQRFGGIQTLSRYLAEDYMAGEAVRRLGLKVVLAIEPVRQFIGEHSFKEFWARHIRWGRIRKSQVLLAFLIEPAFCSVFSAALGGVAFHHLFGIAVHQFLLGHFVFWFLCELPLLIQFGGGLRVRTLFLWIARELSSLPLWLHIAVGNSVQWRGRQYRLTHGGLLEA